MDLGHPLRDVLPGARGALLQALLPLGAPVSRRELARQAGVAPGHANSVLEQLIEAGLVTEQRAGRISLVQANRQHVAIEALSALAGARLTLVDRLRERLADWSELESAWLFGSVSRGDAHAGSDVDILLVATELDSSAFHDHLTALHVDVQGWTGNDLQIVEHTRESWKSLEEEGNALVGEIRRDGIPLTEGTRRPRAVAS